MVAGGTTGKILKKNSNADFDFIWSDESDVTAKADKSQLLVASISGAGPTSYAGETTMLTLTPSTTQSAAKMKYTFMGYLSNNVADTAIIRIRKGSSEIARSVTTVQIGQLNFCLTWIDTYAANDVITATLQCTSDGGDCKNYILICESLNAI